MKTTKLIALTDDEIELLYDGLDALEDRFQRWKDDIEDDLYDDVTDEQVAKLREQREKLLVDLGRIADMNRDFQPILQEIRREGNHTTLPTSASPSDEPRGGDSSRGSDRVGTVSPRKRGRRI